MECAANLAPQCDATPSKDLAKLLDDHCAPDAGYDSTNPCLSQCETELRACNDACLDSDFTACMDCSATCGQQWYACSQGC